MILIIFGIVGAISMAWQIIEPSSVAKWVMFILLGVLLGFFGLLFGGLIAAGIGYFPAQNFTEDKTISLVALQDNSTIYGSFFLGSGSINQEQKYFYMKKVGSGFKQDSISADDVIVFEDDSEPRLVTYESDFVNPWWFIIGLPSQSKDSEIHIPEGSILKDYKIDLQN